MLGRLQINSCGEESLGDTALPSRWCSAILPSIYQGKKGPALCETKGDLGKAKAKQMVLTYLIKSSWIVRDLRVSIFLFKGN